MRFCTLLFFVLILGLSTEAISQDVALQKTVNQLINLNSADPHSKFPVFISSLSNTAQASETKTLRRLFNKAHRLFLKKYEAYTSLEDIFQSGNYDCLSGTYFFSLALDRLGIEYHIIETNYHIFIIADPDNGEVLLESTDRYNGFVTGKKAIAEKISGYREHLSKSSDHLYLSHLNIFHELLPNQLPGLLYFNQAVDAFHKNDLTACCKQLENAWKIYDNPRIEEFANILIRSISVSGLDETQKENLIAVLKSHQERSVHSLASR